tara:strand:- start:2157 stop:3206 length:1050 start_codon:yes stop_codon:yes gene_type:complete
MSTDSEVAEIAVSQSQEDRFFGVQTPVGVSLDSDPVDTSSDTGQIEIEIVDDRPESDQRPAKVESSADGDDEKGELASYGEKVQKRIAKMKYDFHEERRAKEAAIRLADEATVYAQRLVNDNQSVRNLVRDSHQELVKQSHERSKVALSVAESRFKAAHQSGDADEISSAQQAMVEAQMSLAQAPAVSKQIIQSWQDAEKQKRGNTQEVQPSAPQPPTPDPAAVEWQKNNQWFGTNRRMTSLAYGIHEDLVVEGMDPNSQEYYQRIDAEMLARFPEEFGGTSGAERNAPFVEVDTAQGPRRATPVVGAATRNNGAKPRKITLSATQKRLAERLGLTVQQYAEQLYKESL